MRDNAECKPDRGDAWGPQDATLCAAYAKGEDVFEQDQEEIGEVDREWQGNCEFTASGKSRAKPKSAVEAAALAAKCAAADAKEVR